MSQGGLQEGEHQRIWHNIWEEIQGTSKSTFANTGTPDHDWLPYHHGKLQHNDEEGHGLARPLKNPSTSGSIIPP